VLVGLLTVASSLVTLAVPWLAARFLGDMLGDTPSEIGRFVGALLLALTVIALLNYTISYVGSATSVRILADLRVRVYRHVQALPIAFHQNHRQGDTLALMTYEVARLSHFLTGTLVRIPSQLLVVAGAFVLMFQADPKLAIAVLLLVPAFYLLLKLVERRLRGLAKAIQEAEADIMAVAEENLEMLPAIKAFAREDVEARQYASRVGLAAELRLSESRIYAALEPIIGLIAAASAVLLLAWAGHGLAVGSMVPTELFGFFFYAALLTRPIAELAHIYGQLQTALGTLARLQSVLNEELEPGYASTMCVDHVQGGIVFEDVSFTYPGREMVLRGVDLSIAPGEIVALTGPNGAGKSTMINLLLRYYEPDEGRILLDGRDISTLNVQELRRRIGLVSQRILLFNGTIRANIAYGAEDAGEPEIERAARLAQAYDFIAALPHGLDTEIGDHGVRLSGGQRQRVALARALVKNPPILVLDEATSMYDLEGESAFIQACAGALAARTVILITHRPATLALADRVLHLAEGRIEGQAA
jgi:ABC-type multidrug transport system fused ATPase/permease subunit